MADTNLRIKIGLTGSAEVASGLKAIGGAASSLKTSLLAIGTALAGAAGLGALGAAAVATARLGGQLSDLSARTGISARSLIVLRQAFQDTGIGADSVGQRVNMMQRAIFEAATSGGAAADALAGIGLSAQALATLSPEQQFTEVAAAISAIADPAQRSAAAMAIFGKSGAELLPLFAEGGAIQNAEKVLGNMPDVLSRNVPVLDAISDSFDRLPNKATQLFAGILDQLGPTVQAVLEAFESIDLTGIGQKIGAFVNVAIDEFKAGRFGDFIALTVEAGFELGINAVGSMFAKLRDYLSSSTFWIQVGNALLTSINAAMKGVVTLILNLLVPFAAVFDYVKNGLIYAFQSAVSAFNSAFRTAINVIIEKLNSSFGTLGVNIQKLPMAVEEAFEAPDFSKSWDIAKQGAEAGTEYAREFFDSSTQAFRELGGISDFSVGDSALKRLDELMAARLKGREETAGTGAPQGGGTPRDNVLVMDTKLELQRLEIEFNKKLQVLTQQKGEIENSWLMTSAQKYKERKRILTEEQELITAQIEKLKDLQNTAPPSEQGSIEQKIVGLQGRQGQIGTEAMGMGPDPESFSENFSATLINLQNQFGTVAQQMAQTFADVFNAATASISNSIQGLIYGTMTWGAALANIGTGIIKSLIQSFADMVASWIMSHVIMKGVMTAWGAFKAAFVAKDVAVANAGEAAKTPALATNATLASISSWGIAVGVGLAAIAAVLAATGAFKDGGYTGDGNPNDVAGIVHRGEYVVPADAVDRIGVGTLEAMTSGGPATSPMFTSGAAPAPITLNMGVFDDPRRLSDWARSNEGRTVLIDILKQHAHEFTAS
jgi:hypothetical protein